MAVEFTTPVGRLVSGSIYKLSDTDRKGQKRVIKTGPNQGQPLFTCYFALAIEKTNPDWPAFYNLLVQEARSGYPQFFDAQGRPTHPRFTFKISDGDGIDADGKPNNQKEGWAGHWIVKFGGQYLPKVLHDGQFVMQEGYVKNGYFVQVVGNAACNIGSDVPGLYMNPFGVILVGYGKEIVGGPDVLAIAQKAAGMYRPAGMSATPLAGAPVQLAPPAGAAQPGIQATPPAGYGQPMQPQLQPQTQQLVMPGAQTALPQMQPGQQFVQNAIGAVATPPPGTGAVVGGGLVLPGMAPAAQPALSLPVTLKPTHLAQGQPLEVWKQQYTEEQLIAAGVFTR